MRFQLSIIIIVLMLCVNTTQSTSKCEGVSWNTKQNLWQAEFYINGQKKTFYFDNEFDAAKKSNQLCHKMGIPPQKNEKKSQYKGVCWHKQAKNWRVQLWVKEGKSKYGGYFKDELDAAKKVNQLCEEWGIPLQNPGIVKMTTQQSPILQPKSKYEGVSWDEEKNLWKAEFYIYGRKRKYFFDNEFDAAKQLNMLCDKMGIPPQNPEICEIPQQKKEKASQYKGVYWHTLIRKWYVIIRPKGQNKKFGGYFDNELDAAKTANQLCNELGIPLKNPEISAKPKQQLYQKKQGMSQYKGVYWHKEKSKWSVQLWLKEKKQKYGGYFENELDAAKRVNQLCEELEIPLQNPEISGVPNEQSQKKEKTSQYKGVYWHITKGKWCVLINPKGQKRKYGGIFVDELDAAKRANELCKQLKIPLQNPEIIAIPYQQYQTNYKTLLDCDAIKADFENLIKILDENNDPTAHIIKANLITAISYGEQIMMTGINLQTENGESALSIAAKHGLANAVKFLISKGAKKDHFTNQHHTPLSLAVSQNHLKVVQVLFEDWISPNLHENPYLHLSPIFHVKSREIAQLLIDNDAVTHDIYNYKNQSPLTVACQNGYLDVVEFFLDDGLDINHLDSDGRAPLFYALTNKHQEIANLLISKGAQK